MYVYCLQSPGNMFFIAGAYTGLGDFSSRVFVSERGIYCDIKGQICSGKYVYLFVVVVVVVVVLTCCYCNCLAGPSVLMAVFAMPPRQVRY